MKKILNKNDNFFFQSIAYLLFYDFALEIKNFYFWINQKKLKLSFIFFILFWTPKAVINWSKIFFSRFENYKSLKIKFSSKGAEL